MSKNVDPQLVLLVDLLRDNKIFTKKYPDFEITSTYRPLGAEFNSDGTRNYSRSNQWGLYNGWKYKGKKEGYYRAANPANGGGAHNVSPALAIDFKSGNGKDTECHGDILKIANGKVELEPILADDPIHVQLKLFKQKNSKKNSSSSSDSEFYSKLIAIADSIGFAYRDSQKKIAIEKITGPSEFLINHLKINELLKLEAYPDPPKQTTTYSIGYGVQINSANFPDVKKYPNVNLSNPSSSKITEKEADKLLKEVVSRFHIDVQKYFKAGDQIYQHEYDAVFDMAYTLGVYDDEFYFNYFKGGKSIESLRAIPLEKRIILYMQTVNGFTYIKFSE